MSLFRVRNFWSFKISQLYQASLASQIQTKKSDATDINSSNCEDAAIVVCPGCFHSIGDYDVLVCATVDGFVCIIQVPDNQQNVRNINIGTDSDARQEGFNLSLQDLPNRQLLFANHLGFPVVDLKCGFFSSALKQSIAILSLDKLIIYRVKRRQVDFMSIGTNQDILDENLFSHQLEEYYCISLLAGKELPLGLIVATSHRYGSEKDVPELDNTDSNLSSIRKPSAASGNRNSQVKSDAFLQLPQRDTLIIKYANQLIFSMVEHKKVIGHFLFTLSSFLTSEEHQNEEQQMGKFIGFMPMVCIISGLAPGFSSLVLATSDNKLHCLQLSKLTSYARQEVVKRVAQNLLSDKASKPTNSSIPQSNLTYDRQQNVSLDNDSKLIEYDLNLLRDWQVELASCPIQMQAINRVNNHDMSATVSQLLVMSRYDLNLYSNVGVHLWSHQSEMPLICLFAFCLDSSADVKTNHNDSTLTDFNRIVSLVCSEGMNQDRCNLTVMEENRVVWTALLDGRPMQIWRNRLSLMKGVIVSLDLHNGRLDFSYLGTNLDEEEYNHEKMDSSDLSAMDSFDQTTETLKALRMDSDSNQQSEGRQRLQVDVNLEATDKWPNVKVNCLIGLRVSSSSYKPVQNIIASLEFDDIICFELTSSSIAIIQESDNFVQIRLGGCWPDRREPSTFAGRFSIRDQQTSIIKSPTILPKSLQVRLVLKFNEVHSETSIQEEYFQLPLNLMAQLEHIDYSDSMNQSLEDIQANLNLYKRLPETMSQNLEDFTSNNVQPYHLCDLFFNSCHSLIDIVDVILEKDLICRDINSGSQFRYDRELNPDLRRFETLETINMLAQSLDCRLRYKSLSPALGLTDQASEDQSPIIIISIALRLPSCSSIISGLSEDEQLDSAKSFEFGLVWLHLCDLSLTSSKVPEQIIMQHKTEWKTFSMCRNMNCSTENNSKQTHPILLSVESEYPIPILFILNHLIERIRELRQDNCDNSFEYNLLDEALYDKLDIKFTTLYTIKNWIAISNNLHDCLVRHIARYKSFSEQEYVRIMEEINEEYYKFHISVKTSLSVSKRLSNMTGDSLHQFTQLCLLTKKYQSNLLKLINEVSKLKKLDYNFSKIPYIQGIVLENGGVFYKWPNFIQIMS